MAPLWSESQQQRYCSRRRERAGRPRVTSTDEDARGFRQAGGASPPWYDHAAGRMVQSESAPAGLPMRQAARNLSCVTSPTSQLPRCQRQHGPRETSRVRDPGGCGFREGFLAYARAGRAIRSGRHRLIEPSPPSGGNRSHLSDARTPSVSGSARWLTVSRARRRGPPRATQPWSAGERRRRTEAPGASFVPARRSAAHIV